MRCSLCGYEAPLPPPGEGPPFHCEAEMVVARDLRCTVCREETTDTVGLAPHAEPTALAQPPALRQTSVVTPPPEVSELAGKIWATYEIVSEIGHGGMAIVYKARQPRLKRHVAIKLLLPQGRRYRCPAVLCPNLDLVRHPQPMRQTGRGPEPVRRCDKLVEALNPFGIGSCP